MAAGLVSSRLYSTVTRTRRNFSQARRTASSLTSSRGPGASRDAQWQHTASPVIVEGAPLYSIVSELESQFELLRIMAPLPPTSSGEAPSPSIIAAGSQHLFLVLASFCGRHPGSEFGEVEVDAKGGRAVYADLTVPLDLAALLRTDSATLPGGFIPLMAPGGAPLLFVRLVSPFAGMYTEQEFELKGFHGLQVPVVLSMLPALAASSRFPTMGPGAVLCPKMMRCPGVDSGLHHVSGAFTLRSPETGNNCRVPLRGTSPLTLARPHVFKFRRILGPPPMSSGDAARILAPQYQFIVHLAAAGAGRPLEAGTTFPAVTIISPDATTSLSPSDKVGGAAGAAPAGAAADAAAAAAADPGLTRKQKKRRRKQAAKKAAQLRAAGGTTAPPPPLRSLRTRLPLLLRPLQQRRRPPPSWAQRLAWWGTVTPQARLRLRLRLPPGPPRVPPPPPLSPPRPRLLPPGRAATPRAMPLLLPPPRAPRPPP